MFWRLVCRPSSKVLAYHAQGLRFKPQCPQSSRNGGGDVEQQCHAPESGVHLVRVEMGDYVYFTVEPQL